MKNNFDKYLEKNSTNLRFGPLIHNLFVDAWDALNALPRWEKAAHIFWLLGPFILLIERSPADLWLTVLAFTFVVRCSVQRDWAWVGYFWVRAGFVFWLWCLVTAVVSEFPIYSIGETFVWFRFPLFAMATAFWLASDKRLLYLMLFSTAVGLMIMCGILTAEMLIEGQKGGRLYWPYGDKVPGNYLAKVGMPAFTIMVALAVSVSGRVAVTSALLAFITMIISIMTGERVNFFIRACGGMLAGLVWRPKWKRYLILVLTEIFGVYAVLMLLPDTFSRFTRQLVRGVTDVEKSSWLKTINGGWQVAQDNLFFGIGAANYRQLSHNGILDKYENVRADVHPHNFYVQLLVETGLIGLVLGSVFLWAIVFSCFKTGLKKRSNVFEATAWVIPFGMFWPIATSADFFGQWNNVFLWSSVALALTIAKK